MGSVTSCSSRNGNANDSLLPVIIDANTTNIKNQSIISKGTQVGDNMNVDSMENAHFKNDMITMNVGKEELHVADGSVHASTTPQGNINKVQDNITKNEYDIYISYSPDDIEFVLSLEEYLQNHCLKFWPLNYGDENAECKVDKGQAIVNAKVVVAVLSKSYIQNKAKIDEISLAYISNKPILPLSLRYFKEINEEMNFALKLTLSKLNWVFFCKKEKYDERYATVLEGITREIEKIDKFNENSENRRGSCIEDDRFIYNATLQSLSGSNNAESNRDVTINFWDRHFQKQETTWPEFRESFLEDYRDILRRDYSDDRQEWLLHRVLWKDIFNNKDIIAKEDFIKFCGKNWSKPHKFMRNVSNQAASRLAIYEIFNMESTVRMAAVENLGKYQTPIVISVLADLLDNTDPNIRAIASIALVRTGVKDKKYIDKLISLLQDEDRLVRESACLSLGHIKAESSVTDILNRWRNDPISHVREAALIALEEIGGEEANEAVRVTKLLTSEMNELNSYLPFENVL